MLIPHEGRLWAGMLVACRMSGKSPVQQNLVENEVADENLRYEKIRQMAFVFLVYGHKVRETFPPALKMNDLM